MFSSVVLPAPLGPSRPVTPGPSVKETPFTATTFPYQRETSATSTAASGVPAIPFAVPSAALTGFSASSGAAAARPPTAVTARAKRKYQPPAKSASISGCPSPMFGTASKNQ